MFRVTPENYDAKQCPNCHKGWRNDDVRQSWGAQRGWRLPRLGRGAPDGSSGWAEGAWRAASRFHAI